MDEISDNDRLLDLLFNSADGILKDELHSTSMSCENFEPMVWVSKTTSSYLIIIQLFLLLPAVKSRYLTSDNYQRKRPLGI